MTQKEFETLVGYEVSSVEYQNIEMVYMADEDMDKRDFCNMWKNLSEPAQDMMIKMARDKNRTIADGRVAVQELLNEKRRILEVMFERTQKMSDPVLRQECIKQMGGKAYIKKLVEGGYSLWEDDKSLLIEILG